MCCKTLPDNNFARTTQKTASILKEACCNGLAMDVPLLRALAPAGLFLPSRCLAMGICVTILSRFMGVTIDGVWTGEWIY
jgi:hypothetical protein